MLLIMNEIVDFLYTRYDKNAMHLIFYYKRDFLATLETFSVVLCSDFFLVHDSNFWHHSYIVNN